MPDDILRIRDKSVPAEAALCVGKPSRAAEDITELARAIGLIVARATNGDAKTSADLLEGASQRMFEVTADFAPLAARAKAIPPMIPRILSLPEDHSPTGPEDDDPLGGMIVLLLAVAASLAGMGTALFYLFLWLVQIVPFWGTN